MQIKSLEEVVHKLSHELHSGKSNTEERLTSEVCYSVLTVYSS